MSEWKECKLGELAEITSSKRIFYSDYVLSGVRFYRSKEIIEKSLGESSGEPLYITKERFEEIKNKFGAPVDGDLLISAVGERAGIPYVVKNLGDFYFKDGNLIWFRKIKSDLDIHYFCYWMKSAIGQMSLESIMIGSAQKALTISGLKGLEIKIPTPSYQKSIASILSSLDDKIDLLQRQNATLESLAETLFRQWFVYFAENRNDNFISSDIGFIPESLEIVRIEDLSHILETGKRPKGGVGQLLEGVPSVGAESIKGLGVYDYTKTKYISNEFASKMNRGIINGYELLIYKDGGTPGHFIPRYTIFGNGFPYDKLMINEHVFKLDFQLKYFNFFAYFFFQTEITESILVANGAKAAIPGINQDDIKKLWIFSPENSLVKKFGELTLPHLDKILFNCKQIRTLTILRDTLLPKLMSGEVKVD